MFRFLLSIRSALVRLLVRLLNIYATLLFVTCFLSWPLLRDGEGHMMAWVQQVYLILFEPPMSMIRPHLPNRGLLMFLMDDGRLFWFDFAPIPLGILIGMVSSFLSRFDQPAPRSSENSRPLVSQGP